MTHRHTPTGERETRRAIHDLDVEILEECDRLSGFRSSHGHDFDPNEMHESEMHESSIWSSRRDDLDEVVVEDEETGEPLPSTPLSPEERALWEERVAPYRDADPRLTGPATFYEIVGLLVLLELKARIQAQRDYCDRLRIPHFAPHKGVCYCCRKQIYVAISLKKAGTEHITGCPLCFRTYCD